jgi:hypothetical protein
LRVIDMETKLRKPLRSVRLTPKRSPEEQRRLGEAAIKALHELQREMQRNGMTPARAKKILRDLQNERKARRRGG